MQKMHLFTKKTQNLCLPIKKNRYNNTVKYKNMTIGGLGLNEDY